VIKKIKKLSKEKILLLSIVALFFFIFSTISLHRYWQYATWYYDFGIFYGAISSVAQGKEPIIDHFIFTDKNILGDHFHPIIFLLSPFLIIFPKGETLLILQSLIVTLSGIFIYFTAKKIVKNKFQSFLLLIIYFSFIGLHNALITEFHEITLITLPLSIFFYGLFTKKKLFYWIGFVLTLLTKETTFIIPAWFGLLTVIREKKEWQKIGLLTILLSFFYGFFTIFAFIPFINGSRYHYLNDTLSDSKNINLFSELKIKTIFKTFLSFGFLPILSPESLPPVLFNWWTRFASEHGTRHDLGMHYNAEIAPTLAIATIFGWQRLKKIFKKIFKKKINLKLENITLSLLTLFLIFTSLYIFKSPALLFTNRAFYKHTENFDFLNELIKHIPEDGVVMAQTNIAGKIANRKVYMLRDSYSSFNPDYIVIDTRDGQEPNNFLGIKDFDQLVTNLKNDLNFEVYYDQGEQLIYKKR
jgi:uncharacterized membrane protein